MSDSKDLKQYSIWDERTSIIDEKNINLNIKTKSFHIINLQLFGVIGVLLIIIVLVVILTIANSGLNTNTTVLVNTTIITATNTTIVTTTTTTIIVTTTTTANPFACSTMIFLNGTDLVGNDIPPNPVLNYTACCTLCLSISTCVAFTWSTIDNKCYPKYSPGTGGTLNADLYSARY